jgi:hypothetical protein
MHQQQTFGPAVRLFHPQDGASLYEGPEGMQVVLDMRRKVD